MSRGQRSDPEEPGRNGTSTPPAEIADALNRACHCVVSDESEVRRSLLAGMDDADLGARLLAERPHLLSDWPVFLAPDHLQEMSQLVRGVETVVGLEGYRRAVLEGAPEIARLEAGPRGGVLGYDFHITRDGPRLIEINTNPGGALLSLALSDAQQGCCGEVRGLLAGRRARADVEAALMKVFRLEHARRADGGPLHHIAIVDEDPASQFLYPELLAFRTLFERHGLTACVADPSELTLEDGRLRAAGQTIDLVYNRLTDFYLESLRAVPLRRAHERGVVTLTPDPRGHALFAHKRNLALLSDPERLESLSVPSGLAHELARTIPRVQDVTPENAEALWSRRRQLFFKPVAGYASRGAYRGAKLTRRVWQSVVAGGYVAQERVPPSERSIPVRGEAISLKLDVRCYAYAGEILLVAARLYRGQTTNLRTEGGGLGSVLVIPPAVPDRDAA